MHSFYDISENFVSVCVSVRSNVFHLFRRFSKRPQQFYSLAAFVLRRTASDCSQPVFWGMCTTKVYCWMVCFVYRSSHVTRATNVFPMNPEWLSRRSRIDLESHEETNPSRHLSKATNSDLRILSAASAFCLSGWKTPADFTWEIIFFKTYQCQSLTNAKMAHYDLHQYKLYRHCKPYGTIFRKWTSINASVFLGFSFLHRSFDSAQAMVSGKWCPQHSLHS